MTSSLPVPASGDDRGPIAMFLPFLGGGGAERVTLNLAAGVAARGLPVDLVLATSGGALSSEIPKNVRLIELGCRRTLASVPALSRYLKQQKPSALLAALSHANLAALGAARLARYAGPIVVAEHHHPGLTKGSFVDGRVNPFLMRLLYKRATRVVAVSEGIKEALEDRVGLDPERIAVIYNPVISEAMLEAFNTPVHHPFLEQAEEPVVLAVGRLTRAKNFRLLIEAFEIAHKRTGGKLLVLGEGELRSELEDLVGRLGLQEHVSMPGFVSNPYGYFRKASVFVLSSDFEALPTVLIEALAAGVPVVSTDCPSGPREVLADGLYGELVPMGDPHGLAGAIERALSAPHTRPPEDWLEQFGLEFATSQYLALLNGAA